MSRRIIATASAPAAIGPYSQAVQAGDTVYLSGQIGLDPATMQMAEGIDAQIARVFDKLKADFAKALFSIPAVVGVEYGSGFAAATMRGSEHNDLFVASGGPATPSGSAERVATASNRHGGMLGGISSGMPIVLRAALKPTSSLPREQATVNRAGEPTTIRTTGRHDPCLLPRFVPVAEAMLAIVLADHWLRQQAIGR